MKKSSLCKHIPDDQEWYNKIVALFYIIIFFNTYVILAWKLQAKP